MRLIVSVDVTQVEATSYEAMLPSALIGLSLSLICQPTSEDIKQHIRTSLSSSEPVWPSGKAGMLVTEQPRDLGSNPASAALLSLQLVVVCGHCLVTLSFTIMKH